MTICLVDTSVFCNVLDVPGRNQRRDEVLELLARYLDERHTLLLPLAAVYETGNHIAHVGDGRLRRGAARRFTDQVGKALGGDSPWVPTPFPAADVLLTWLDEFPDHAMRAVGLGDLSIIKDFERQCDLNPARRVFIWSHDADLSAHDRKPSLRAR